MTYKEFIQNIIDTRGQWNIPEGEYFEKHHIIPKCLGGSNNKENIIWLYAKEHFIAHKLLSSENPENIKLQYAFGAMASNNKGLRNYSLTEEEYELTRKAYSFANSKRMSGKNNPMYGKSAIKGKHVHSEEFKQDLSKRFSGKGNPMYGKSPLAKLTEEELKNYKNNLSIKTKERYSNLSEEEYKKLCASVSGANNGMYGKYGVSSKSVKIKCIETDKIYCSISDAERKTGIKGIKIASKTGSIAGGYHWERVKEL